MEFIVERGGINNRIDINKNQTIRPNSNGCAVLVNGNYVFRTSMDVFHESKYFESNTVSNELRIRPYEKRHLINFLMKHILAAGFGAQIINETS